MQNNINDSELIYLYLMDKKNSPYIKHLIDADKCKIIKQKNILLVNDAMHPIYHIFQTLQCPIGTYEKSNFDTIRKDSDFFSNISHEEKYIKEEREELQRSEDRVLKQHKTLGDIQQNIEASKSGWLFNFWKK